MSRSPRCLAASLVLLVTLAALARAEPHYRLGDSTALAPPPADHATLCFTREQFVRGYPLKPEALFLDGAALAWLPQRAYVAATVAPGRHCVSGLAGMAGLCLDCSAGRRYLLRLRESVDDADHLRLDWLLDDPERIEPLVRDSPLPRASTTAKGVRALAQRTPRVAANPGATDTARDTLPLVLEGMWYESPLDPENLKTSFRRETCRMIVDSGAVRVVSKRHALEVPIARITSLHFGGTRATTNNPWLEIGFEGEDSPRIASFADSNPESAVRTYNRLFAALSDLWRAADGAAQR